METQLTPTERGTAVPNISAHVCCGQTVAHLSNRLLTLVRLEPKVTRPPAASIALTRSSSLPSPRVVSLESRYTHTLDRVAELWHRPPQTHHNHFTAFFRDHPCQPVPEENFWTLWCNGRLTEADTYTDHPPGRHFIRTNQCPPPPSTHFLQAGCSSCRPTNSAKALKAKATSAFGLGRRR